MEKTIIGLAILTVSVGGAGGAYWYLNSDTADLTKTISSAYWGPTCGLSPTGFVVCANEAGLRFDSCSTPDATYRLKVSVLEPRYQPISLEVWTDDPRGYMKLETGEIYGEGTGVCYYESYRFKDAGILINKGSKCGPGDTLSDDSNLMFYVSTETTSATSCTVDSESSTAPTR